MAAEAPVVLVVDDTPTTLTLITEVLRDRCALRVATRGARALEIVARQPIDLVLLDINMPDMDGYEVCRRLKERPETAGIPVIFLTGRNEVEDEAQGFAVGAADYIHKPFSPSILRARVSTHLALVAALREAEAARARADRLLDAVLPPPIADELRRTGRVAPRRRERAAVLFCDVVGFTQWCEEHSPEEVVAQLDGLDRLFERVAEAAGVLKIKTLGDGFLGAVGALDAHPAPLEAALACGRALLRETPVVAPGWRVRVGVYAGPVVAGLAGQGRYQFDVWGDTVNLAARLCSSAQPDTVALDAAQCPDGMPLVWRGTVVMKGKGRRDVNLIGP